jgi:hypothetical protein
MRDSKTYVLTVIGENLQISRELRKALGGHSDRALSLGFTTTRIVSANDVTTAKKQAVREAYDTVLQALPLPLANGEANPPNIRVEQVRELAEEDDDAGPQAGFRFFAGDKPTDVAAEAGGGPPPAGNGSPPARKSLWQRIGALFSR